jgi:hypothetical protein
MEAPKNLEEALARCVVLQTNAETVAEWLQKNELPKEAGNMNKAVSFIEKAGRGLNRHFDE